MNKNERDQVLQLVIRVLTRHCSNQPKPMDNLRNDCGLSSLDTMFVSMTLEKEIKDQFNLKIKIDPLWYQGTVVDFIWDIIHLVEKELTKNMRLIYITPKSSTTGQKVTRVLDLCRGFRAAEKAFKAKYHVQHIYCYSHQLCGAVCATLSADADMSKWRRFGQNGFIPAKGKKLLRDWEELEALFVNKYEIDACIGGLTSFFQAGFAQTDDYYFFAVKAGWNYNIPDDLRLITEEEYAQYNNL